MTQDYILKSGEADTARTVFVISRLIEQSASDKLPGLLKYQPSRSAVADCSREVARAKTDWIDTDITVLAGLDDEASEDASRKSKTNYCSQGTPIPSSNKNEFFFG